MGRSLRRSAANTASRPAGSSFGASWPCAGRGSGPTTSCSTSPTFRWRLWRPRTTTTRSAADCRKPSVTRRPSTCPSCSRRTATPSCSTTAPGNPPRSSGRSAWTNFPPRKTCGGATGPGKGSTTHPASSPGSPVTKTPAARSLATTSAPPSSGRWRRSRGADAGCCWPWPRARERPSPSSRSSGGCGKRKRSGGCCSSWIGTSSPTRP